MSCRSTTPATSTAASLSMRLVGGTDLRNLLRAEGALEPARALAICRQVASALDAAYAKGLVHRDVKPSNVLLDDNDHVYLADFGLTRRLDAPGAAAPDDGSVGTPAYLAPEQIEIEGVDGRTDLYSLGCMLFECLTGAPPFARGSRLETAWAHLEEEPPSAHALVQKLPEAIDPVVRMALAKEPDDRYPTCTALISAAEHALGFERSTPLHRRKSVLLVAAIMLMGIAAERSPPFSLPTVTARPRHRCSPERIPWPASIPRRTRSAPLSTSEQTPSSRRQANGASGSTTRAQRSPRSTPTRTAS